MFKNALVSVSNKENLDQLIEPFFKKGMRVLSTGGTASFLRKKNIDVIDVSHQTKFPEVMNNRVKTLHPFIHMCLLARDDVPEDLKLLKKYSLQPIDLVVVNLYPFHKATQLKAKEQVDWIDIGGPTLLRSAAKNYFRITVICDPSDYEWILNKKGDLSLKERKSLALKAFSHVSLYDATIAKVWRKSLDQDLKNLDPKNKINKINFNKEFSFGGKLKKKLRYGENPQQEGFWYANPNESGFHKAELLQGKSLSYNNLLDLDAALRTLNEFKDSLATVSVKHNSPCAVALGQSVSESIEKCLKGDPLSVFGGIVAVNGVLDSNSVKDLKSIFLECIIAKDFSKEFLDQLQTKKNLRLLRFLDLKSIFESQTSPNQLTHFRSLLGGFLIQNPDSVDLEWNQKWEIIGQTPSEKIKQDLLMAWKVCAHLKSNAIAIVSNKQTLGLGMGQVNRIDAVKQAISRMKQFHPQAKEPVLASDAFFPFPDSIEIAAKSNIRWIIQPGGSVKDDEVKAKAQKLGVHLIFTRKRHFLH